jgi:hypothetical protein
MSDMRARSIARLAPALEWTGGASRAGESLHVRADVIWRRQRPWSASPAPASPPEATSRIYAPAAGVDLGLLETRYAALVLQSDYDLGPVGGIGARYTLSRHWEAGDGTGIPGLGDLGVSAADLGDDRRHRVHLWGHARLIASERHGRVDLGVLQAYASGVPYGVAAWVDLAPYLPGDAASPRLVPYRFTARDAFRGRGLARSDLFARYTKAVPGTLRSAVVFEVQALNVFAVRHELDPASRVVASTAFSHQARFAAFDPLTVTPSRGVHWDLDSRFATSPPVLTRGRACRVSGGVRCCAGGLQPAGGAP